MARRPRARAAEEDDGGSRPHEDTLRARLREIVFGTTTTAGRVFDLFLIISILASVLAVMLASVSAVRAQYGDLLRGLEWGFTFLFSAEYILRIWIARDSRGYVTSFFGIVDLLAIIPTYLSLLLPGAEYLLVVRGLRVLRVFRILKLLSYMDSAVILKEALWNSRHKITVFFITVLTLVTVFGALMYLVEGESSGFTSIPISVYWAVVTLTTVGYGDISPHTSLGQGLSMIIMLLGYAIIAVPTGIVTAELTRFDAGRRGSREKSCGHCGAERLRSTARFCDQCGEPI